MSAIIELVYHYEDVGCGGLLLALTSLASNIIVVSQIVMLLFFGLLRYDDYLASTSFLALQFSNGGCFEFFFLRDSGTGLRANHKTVLKLVQGSMDLFVVTPPELSVVTGTAL